MSLRGGDCGGPASPFKACEVVVGPIDQGTLLAIVRTAWRSELEQSPSTTTTWESAGGDSIRMLSFLLELEKQIGRKPPLEFFSLEMTPHSLAKDLAGTWRDVAEDTGEAHARPLVFLIGDDHPSAARFRADLKANIRFAVIELTPWRELIDKTFEMIVDATLKEVLEKNDSDSFLLAGESFGGFIAWETARRLSELGHHVQFVGLLDTRHPNLIDSYSPRRGAIRVIRDFISQPAAEILTLACQIVERAPLPLVKIMWFAVENLFSKRATALSYKFAVAFRRRMIKNLDLHTLSVPTVLFRSGEYIVESPDYGWESLCPQLSIVEVGGEHVLVKGEGFSRKFLESVTNTSF